MIRPRIYVDTSIIGGCLDSKFEKYSNQLFEEFITGKKKLVISDLVLFELEGAPRNVKEILNRVPEENIEYIFLNEESISLANSYLKERVIGENSLSDARHIAIATVERVDVLVSWNFKHIVNLNRIHLINSVNLKLGYPMLEIRSPLEVTHED
jgi:predicted nucleic acid-binding protein